MDLDAPVRSIAFSSLKLGTGADAKYYYDQSLPDAAVHFWRQEARLGERSRLKHYSALLGGHAHKNQLDVRLEGPGSKSELRGVLLGSGRQACDFRTTQWHAARETVSDLSFRTALKDRAKSIYTGLIRMEKNAARSDAFQQNDNLLMSNDARADSIPILEILTDDVRCKHGSTAGPVRPEELFYLTSRGLEPEEAERMLVLGFLEPVLGQFPEKMKEELSARLEAKLK